MTELESLLMDFKLDSGCPRGMCYVLITWDINIVNPITYNDLLRKEISYGSLQKVYVGSPKN